MKYSTRESVANKIGTNSNDKIIKNANICQITHRPSYSLGGNVENVRDKNKTAASKAVCEAMRLFLNELN
jgi:hypothetical protein